MPGLRGISAEGWMGLARWTIFGTAGCILVANLINYLMFRDFGDAALTRAMKSATLIPIVLAAPLFFYLTLKLRELAVVNHRLNEMANTDALTRCLNRGAFARAVSGQLAEARPGATFALLVIDADHFKSINDSFGHDEGDTALRIIARSLQASVRAGDTVGRLGGEEFGVFLPGVTGASAEEIAKRIRSAIGRVPFTPQEQPYRLSASIGATVTDQPSDFDTLFREADRMLYAAKKAGRDRVVIDFPSRRPDRSLRIANQV